MYRKYFTILLSFNESRRRSHHVISRGEGTGRGREDFFHLDKMRKDDPDEIMNAIMESQALFESHENQILDTLARKIQSLYLLLLLQTLLYPLEEEEEEKEEVEEENKSAKSRRKLFQSGNQRIEEEILRLKAKSLPGHLRNKILSRLDGLKDFSADISSHEEEESVLVEEENVVEEKVLVEENVSMNDFQQDDFSSQSESVSAEPASQTEPVCGTGTSADAENTSGWWTQHNYRLHLHSDLR